MSITYTFHDTVNSNHPQAGECVEFGTHTINGKQRNIVVRTAGKPDLKALVAVESTPEFKLAAKIALRRELICEYNGLIQESSDRFSDMMDDEMNDGVRSPKSLDKEIAVARTKLVEFDAANPDVLAAIAAAEKESLERNMWN